jgi:hypothetical protein
MTQAQNSPQANDVEPVPSEPAPEHTSGPAAGADHDACNAFGMDRSADLGGRTSLGRPPATQGRRTLFRR